MKFRNTAILALVVAALGAYLYWVERPALEHERQTARILEVDPDQVTRVELRNPTHTIELRRNGDGWQITAPVAAKADPRTVDALIRSASEAAEKSAIETTDLDLSQFGLEPPQATLQLYVEDRALPTLSVGKNTPIGFQAYARRGDETRVLLTAGTVRAALSRRLDDLRDKTISDFTAKDVVSLEIRAQAQAPLRLERTDPGWKIATPLSAPADADAVAQLLRALTALRAVEFIDDAASSPGDYGLDPARLEVVIETNEAPSRRLRVGNEVERGDKKLVAAAFDGDSQIYLVASHVPAGLGRSLDDLRDKKVLRLDPAAVAKVSVTRADQDNFSMVRASDGWNLQEESEDNLDQALTERFFQNLLTLRGQEILAETEILRGGLAEEPAFEVEFIDAAGNSLARLIVARSDRSTISGYVVGTSSGGPTYALSKADRIRIDRRPGELLAIDESPSVTD